jgi:hypothetical protein
MSPSRSLSTLALGAAISKTIWENRDHRRKSTSQEKHIG